MKRSVLFEALVVGLHLKLILTGALIHLFFEYSPFGNLNKMWCRATFPKGYQQRHPRARQL